MAGIGQDRSGTGIILKRYLATEHNDSKNKVFKPLLTNGAQSALIEEREIYIPVKKPELEQVSIIKNTLLTNAKAADKKSRAQIVPLCSQKGYSATKLEQQNIEKRISSPHRYKDTPSKVIDSSSGTNWKVKMENSSKSAAKMTSCKEASIVTKPLVYNTQRHMTSSEEIPIRKTVLSPHNTNSKVTEETKVEVKKSETYSKGVLDECKMTEEEKSTYGDRCPSGYQKISLLGKGGCALVWLGKKIDSDKKVAIKQFAKSGSYKSKSDVESCKAEIEIGQFLFHSKGLPRCSSKEFPGIMNLAAYLATVEDSKDIWAIYELGGTSLTKLLFDIKGEFFKGERLYKVTHQPFYEELKKDTGLLKKIIRKLLEVANLLQHYKIVHCDLKPDNLLVDYDGKNLELKIIDFGSAFLHGQPGSLRMATPEYMPPECLELMQSATEGLESLSVRTQPWSVDIWSIGAILLEILTGFPQWLSLKGRVQGTKKSVTGQGVFAVQGKISGKIIQKQKETVARINDVLNKYNCFLKDKGIVELLGKMLDLNPKTRISPEDALNHPSLLNYD